jgi:DNA recombination protein RmuC
MDVNLLSAVLLGMVLGAALGAWFATSSLRSRHAAALAAATTEAGLLRQRADDLQAAAGADRATAAALGPLAAALGRVEQHVGTLERDRMRQYGELGARLAEVTSGTAALRAQTATLVGSLSSSTVRGVWGENQLRRTLEHSGMLARCDFEEQVRAVSRHDRLVRPDVVVRLPGDKVLVIDAKAPLSAFLSAHADGVDPVERDRLMTAHGAALRAHLDSLAAKAYWSAFDTSPEMVVCFVPGDAILAAALAADPALFDDAQSRRVVLASPSTLMALLRSVAFAWQQDSLAANARQLLTLGSELYARLASLGGHVTKMGASLRRSVETYNAMVGALESRVLVTARRMHDLQLADEAPPSTQPIDVTPRVLTAAELLDAVASSAAARPDLELAAGGALPSKAARQRGA